MTYCYAVIHEFLVLRLSIYLVKNNFYLVMDKYLKKFISLVLTTTKKHEKKKKSMNQVRLSFFITWLNLWNQLNGHLLRCAYAHLLTSLVRFCFASLNIAHCARHVFMGFSSFLSSISINYKFVRFLGVSEGACRLALRGVTHD